MLIFKIDVIKKGRLVRMKDLYILLQGQKLYLASIFQDSHGTGGAESSDDISYWKVDPNNQETMQLIKTLIEYNVCGITAAFEDDNEYQYLQDHLQTIGLNDIGQ